MGFASKRTVRLIGFVLLILWNLGLIVIMPTAVRSGFSAIDVLYAWIAGSIVFAVLALSRERQRGWKVLFLLPVGMSVVVLAPMLVAGTYWGFVKFVPAYSAKMHSEQLDVEIRVDVFRNWSAADRYLYVSASAGGVVQKMAEDWGPASRTSVYRTPDGRFVILGPARDDYLISLTPPKVEKGFKLHSNDWKYLGAFDEYTTTRDGERVRIFRFIPADRQAECIPTLMDGAPAGLHRSAAYRRRCPRYKPDTD